MKYTPSQREILFKKVIRRLQNGESLRQILSDKGTPSRTAFYSWIEEDEDFKERFARASEIGDEVLMERTLEIAETPLYEKVVTTGKVGKMPTSSIVVKDNVQRSKLMIETIDKVLARRNPRKYGSKIDVTSGDQAINMPAIVGMSIKNTAPVNDSNEQTSGSED